MSEPLSGCRRLVRPDEEAKSVALPLHSFGHRNGPGMNGYPTIEEAMHPFSTDALAAFGYDENTRTKIAFEQGLPNLAIADQFARAMAELGVIGIERSNDVRLQIQNALLLHKFRGFASGETPPPAKLKKAIKQISNCAAEIDRSLELIFDARRDLYAAGDSRAEALRQVHLTILGSVAANVLPAQLREKFTDDDIANVMPESSFPSFSNPWVGGFARVADIAKRVHDEFANSELAKAVKNPVPQPFVDFVHRLGAIFRNVTGDPPRANKPTSTQPTDWHSPFVRFLLEVWPLTHERTHGIDPPADARIRRALKSTPSF